MDDPKVPERERDEPLVGLATTRQLLEELEVRMRVTQNSNKGRDLGRLCEEALENLDRGVLDCRTVGPWGPLADLLGSDDTKGA